MEGLLEAIVGAAYHQAELRCSVAERALEVARLRDLDEARADLADRSAEAALSDNPRLAAYYDSWIARTL